MLCFNHYFFHQFSCWAAGVVEQEGFWVHQELLAASWYFNWDDGSPIGHQSCLLCLRCLRCPAASLECAGSCCPIKQSKKGSSLSQASGQETKILVAMAHSPKVFKNFVTTWSRSIFFVHKHLKEVQCKLTFEGVFWPSLSPHRGTINGNWWP